ncbi:hypothetical protein MTO96_002210 [Rhipicephalus appendiculatus]
MMEAPVSWWSEAAVAFPVPSYRHSSRSASCGRVARRPAKSSGRFACVLLDDDGELLQPGPLLLVRPKDVDNFDSAFFFLFLPGRFEEVTVDMPRSNW